MVAHVFNCNTRKAPGEFLWVLGQPDLHGDFEDSQGYAESHCLNKHTYINSFKEIKYLEINLTKKDLVLDSFMSIWHEWKSS